MTEEQSSWRRGATDRVFAPKRARFSQSIWTLETMVELKVPAHFADLFVVETL